MHSRLTLAAVSALVALAAGCRGEPHGSSKTITAEGCLTGGAGGYVLTRLSPAKGAGRAVVEPTGGAAPPPSQATEVFTLQGMDDQLRPHVGKQVKVSGEAPSQEVVVAANQTPAAPGADTAGDAAATGTSGGLQPRVTTSERTRFETADLVVHSVTPLNEPCVATR